MKRAHPGASAPAPTATASSAAVAVDDEEPVSFEDALAEVRPTLDPSKSRKELFVGNLDHRITEFMVLKVFNKFGKIAKLEFMWHKSGLRRGQPRGCCFIEYSTSEDAAAAKAGVHGKRMLGRPVIVRFVDERVVSTTGPQGKRDAATMAAAAAAAAAAAPATGTTMSHDKLEAVYESKIQELSKHLDVLKRQKK